MADVRAGAGELPEQVQADQGMGRTLHQAEGKHKFPHCNEAVTLFQGVLVSPLLTQP